MQDSISSRFCLRLQVCILAGYTDEMQSFLAADPGLSRRFPQSCRMCSTWQCVFSCVYTGFEFAPYSVEQLTAIFHMKMAEKKQTLAPGVAAKVHDNS